MIKDSELTEKLLKDNKNTPHPHQQHAVVDKWTAAFNVIKDAIPATFGLLFVFICETINIIFIGKYNDSELISGIGIGTLYINATGYILGTGLIGGLDTLCSQTFGAKKYRLMGIYWNIARITALAFFLILCCPMIYYSGQILALIGQFPIVCGIASRFGHSMLPSLFFALQYNTNLRYLQNMNIFSPGMYVTLITAAFHPLWCHIFINMYNWDVMGAGVAMGITQFLNFLFITIYIHVKNPCPESYFYFDSEIFQVDLIWDFLKKAVPSAILMAADWLGFEILILMSSYLSPLDLAANVCLFNFITLIFMIPLGLSFATSTLVGNSMGSGDVENAKRYAWSALLAGLTMIGISTLLVLFYKDLIPYVYTTDPEIANIVTGLLGIYVCFSLVDCASVILNGVIKGLGKQKVASIICLVILYPVNIPCAYTFAFVWGYGLWGLWYSQLCSIFMMCTAYIWIVSSVDWDKLSDEIIDHYEKNEKADLARLASKKLK